MVIKGGNEMQVINNIITQVFDLVLLPFGALPPLWGLLVVSSVTGVVMVIIFKHTSNQAAIRKTKDTISAYFLEVRLFKDDLGLMLEAQRRIVRSTLTYMRYSVTPMLVMFVPVILIMIQLGIRYEHRGLKPGDSVLAKLRFDGAESVENVEVSVEGSDGLRLETPLLRIPAEQEIDFRIRIVEGGEHAIVVHAEDENVGIPIIVSDKVLRVYSTTSRPTFMGMLLAPGQSPLPEGSRIKEVRIDLPSRAISVLGRRVNWLVIFLIVSMGVGYLLKRPFKVEL